MSIIVMTISVFIGVVLAFMFLLLFMTSSTFLKWYANKCVAMIDTFYERFNETNKES